MSHFYFLRKKTFKLEKQIFLPKKCIYFITYSNEHPVFIICSVMRRETKINNVFVKRFVVIKLHLIQKLNSKHLKSINLEIIT